MPVSVRRTFLSVGLALSVLSISTRVEAQVPARRSVLSVNPLGIPFEYFSAELERLTSPLVSFGLQGSYFGPDEGSYTTLEGKMRFYPNEEWPRGFSVGLAAGITRVSGRRFDEVLLRDEEGSETRPTIGVIVDYNWVMGKAQRVISGVGVGAKRLLGAEGDYNDLPTAYPTFRFQIGVLF